MRSERSTGASIRKNFSAFLAYLRFALTFSSAYRIRYRIRYHIRYRSARAYLRVSVVGELGTTVDPQAFVYYLELQEGPNKNRFVHDIRLLIR